MAQTLSNAKATYGVTAKATPTRTNVSGANTLGVALKNLSFSDADIVHSFTVTATGGSDVATYTFSSGAVAQTTGTPTIEDAGVNQEGEALVTLVNGYVCIVEQTVAGDVAISGSWLKIDDMAAIGDGGMAFNPAGWTAGSGTMVITFSTSGAAVKVTTIGKSS